MDYIHIVLHLQSGISTLNLRSLPFVGVMRSSWHPQGPIQFKYETISLCHPERSEGSLAGQRSFAEFTLSGANGLRMTLLHRLRLTRTTSSLKCIGPCPRPRSVPTSSLGGPAPALARLV